MQNTSPTERKRLVLEVITNCDQDELFSTVEFETKNFVFLSKWESIGNLEAVLEALKTAGYILSFELVGTKKEEIWRVFDDDFTKLGRQSEFFTNTRWKITKGERYNEAKKFVQDNSFPVFGACAMLEDNLPDFQFNWETGNFYCGEAKGKFRKGDTYYNVMLEFTRHEGEIVTYERLLGLMRKTEQAKRISELAKKKKKGDFGEEGEKIAKKAEADLKRSIFEFIKILKKKFDYSKIKDEYQIFEHTKEKGGGYIFRTPATISYEKRRKA